jgi:lysophospholipase L1-like esterase
MYKNNNYANKFFSILGDSISTFEGYSEPADAVYYDTPHKLASGILTRSDTWWGQVIKHLGGELLVNNSFSGSTVCWHPLYEIPSYACSDERTSSLGREGLSPDVIMVYIGTNDWGSGTRVFADERFGTIENETTLFMSAYRIMLEKIKANYPNAEIWCFTLAISKCTARPTFSFPYYYGGRNITEYCEAIRACAREFGCRVIDLYDKAEPYDTIDCFHPTAEGMKTIADAVIGEVAE